MTEGPNPWSDEETQGGPFEFDFDADIPLTDTDIDYVRLGEVNLTPGGELFAEIYIEPGAAFSGDEIDLTSLEQLLGIEDRDLLDWRAHLEPIPPDFDFSSDNVRGPFPDEESVRDWLEETGLEQIADWFFDEESDSYYIELEDSP